MLQSTDNHQAILLKEKLNNILLLQGFQVDEHGISTKENGREAKRSLHTIAKIERIKKHTSFLQNNIGLIKQFSLDGKDLDVAKITPRLIEVESESKDEVLFKWWNMVWWSLPYEHAYGRQMRYMVWDDYHNAPIGLIGLQSPILSWSVRDKYLNIPYETRDFWVNQSLSAQRLGALPPYNSVLGGKLVGMLLTSDIVRKAFARKYRGKETVMQKRKIPAKLLFVTTTGAFGKSSVYNRLKFHDEQVAKFIGYTNGYGSFHIPDSLYGELISYLETLGKNISRGYGSGPSRKMRLIEQAMDALGIRNGTSHGVKRAVYFFPMVSNIHEVISNNAKPIWHKRPVKDLTDFWKQRWAVPRSLRNEDYKEFIFTDFLKQTISEINNSTLFENENEKIDYVPEL